MRRLKNVHPSDLAAYPLGTGNFAVGAADPGSKIVMYNESPLNIVLDFFNGNTDTLHAWEANVWILDGDTPQIQWSIDADSISATTPPISAIFLTLYGAKEQIAGTYPTNLFRQANIGNTGGISTTVSSTNAIANDGNAAGTPIIESTVTGHTGTNILTNDGLLNLVTLIGASLVQLIKTQNTGNPLLLGAASTITEVLGNLTVDGTLIVTGGAQLGLVDSYNTQTFHSAGITGATNVSATTLQSNVLNDSAGVSHIAITTGSGVTRIQDANSIALQVPGGTTQLNVTSGNVTTTGGFTANNGATINNGSFTVTSSSVAFTTASVGFIAGSVSRMGYASGTTSGTYTHNLGVTPDFVSITQHAVGSETVGYSADTSTNMFVTSGNGASWYAWLMKR